jgi:hypothetical protein
MAKRDDLPPLERAVSDGLDHVNHACHGLTSSWAYPEEFLEQLGDAGYEVAATVDLDELRRTASRADVLARGHADVYGDYQAAQQRAEKAEAEAKRLRAGEADQPVEPGSVLTPERWIRKFNDASAGRRLAWADRILRLAEEDARCFQLDHEGAVEQLREAWDAISRLQRARAATDQDPPPSAIYQGEGTLRPTDYEHGWNDALAHVLAALDGEETHD